MTPDEQGLPGGFWTAETRRKSRDAWWMAALVLSSAVVAVTVLGWIVMRMTEQPDCLVILPPESPSTK